MFKFGTFGEWDRAERVLNNLSHRVVAVFKATIDKNGELIKDTLVGHIDSQDLGWTPLSEKTIAIKNGNSKIYVETGTLRNGIECRKLSLTSKGYSIAISCDPSARNDDGTLLGDILVYLEYGTIHIPARPLLRPTWDEVKPVVKRNMKEVLRKMIRGDI